MITLLLLQQQQLLLLLVLVAGGRAVHARAFFFTFQLLDSDWTRFSLFRGLQIFSAFPGIWRFSIFVVSAAGSFSLFRSFKQSAFARFCCFGLLRFSVLVPCVQTHFGPGWGGGGKDVLFLTMTCLTLLLPCSCSLLLLINGDVCMVLLAAGTSCPHVEVGRGWGGGGGGGIMTFCL